MTGDLLETCDHVLDLVASVASSKAEASVSVLRGPGALTRFANSFIHQNVAEDDADITLRLVVDGGRSATSTTTRTDAEGLEALVRRTHDAAKLRPPDPEWPGMAPAAPLASVDDHWDDGTAEATPDARAERVRAFVDAGRERNLHAAGFMSTSGKHAAFANTAGQRVTGRSAAAVLEGIHRSATGDGAGRASSIRLTDIDGAGAGETAAHKAAAQDDLADAEPGTYEVILEPACVANMLRFLTALGFNAKSLADGTSFVHLGEQQFDEHLDIWDDATDPRTEGFLFDAEGTPKRRLDLVRAGVTTAVAHDRRTATKAGVESTGHGTGDESSGGIPANVFLGAATTDHERSVGDLVAGITRGLLVTDFHYTRILDPKTQVVTGLTRNGTFLIEDGRIAGAIHNLRFTQSYVAALGPGKVLGVGNDAALVSGSQLGGATHVPSLHLASWNFTGGAGG